MARTFNGSNQYLTVESYPVTTYPITFSAWFNVPSTTTKTILSIGGNAQGTKQEFFMYSAS